MIGLKYIWVSSEASIRIAKNRKELRSDRFTPVHFAQNGAGPNGHDFQKTKTDKILKMGAIESVEMNWAAPILLA